jgi:hypothetical protein
MKKKLAVVFLMTILPTVVLGQTVANFRKQHPRIVNYDHGDPTINDFARLVAEAMAVPYFVEHSANGPKVWLAPKDDKQDHEIQHRLSQFNFVMKACGKPDLVTPRTPAGTVKSC